RGRDTWVGTFLSSKTDCKVTIATLLGSSTAVLRKNPVRCDQKRYYFEIMLPPTTGAPGDGDEVGEKVTDCSGVGPGGSETSLSSPTSEDRLTGDSASSPSVQVTLPAADSGVRGNDLDWGS